MALGGIECPQEERGRCFNCLKVITRSFGLCEPCLLRMAYRMRECFGYKGVEICSRILKIQS